MDLKELEAKLIELKVNPNHFSLNGESKPDTVILYQNYSKWEVYYFDERGEKNDMRTFNLEKDACSYFYRLFKDAKAVEDEFGIDN